MAAWWTHVVLDEGQHQLLEELLDLKHEESGDNGAEEQLKKLSYTRQSRHHLAQAPSGPRVQGAELLSKFLQEKAFVVEVLAHRECLVQLEHCSDPTS